MQHKSEVGLWFPDVSVSAHHLRVGICMKSGLYAANAVSVIDRGNPVEAEQGGDSNISERVSISMSSGISSDRMQRSLDSSERRTLVFFVDGRAMLLKGISTLNNG